MDEHIYGSGSRRESASAKTKRLVGMALFSAIIVVLQVFATFVKFGAFSPTLALVPIVVGAALYGPRAGAWLGGVFGVVVLAMCIAGADMGGAILWNANPFITALLCIAKGAAAGCCAGLVYTALAKSRRYLGVFLAALACPIVNTGLFCAGMAVFFKDILTQWAGGTEVVYYVIVVLIGLNFLLETVINIIMSPIIARIINIGKKV